MRVKLSFPFRPVSGPEGKPCDLYSTHSTLFFTRFSHAHWSMTAGYRKRSSADNRMFWSLKLSWTSSGLARQSVNNTRARSWSRSARYRLQAMTRLHVSTCRLNTTGNLTCTATFNDLWCFARRILPVLLNSDSVIWVPATSFFEHKSQKENTQPSSRKHYWINETLSNPPPDWIQWQ